MLRRSDMPAIRIFLPFRITPKILEHSGVALAGFFACGDRSVPVRPVAPRARVEAAATQPGDLHRQQVVRRGDTGAAVEDRAVLSSKLGNPLAQLSGRLEAPVGAEVLLPRRAQRSGDVTCLRVDGLRLPPIPLDCPPRQWGAP